MSSHPPQATPIRYTPSVEIVADDEQETIQGLIDTMTKIQEITLQDEGHAIRGVHAKSHGLIAGRLIVADGLPAILAQGLFAHGGTYPVVMRISTIPGDILDDNVSTPRGLAVKVLGVDGERLPGAEGSTQDFVLVNGPAFAAPTAKKFLGTVKLLASTTDKAPELKKIFSTALQVVERGLEAVGGKSATLTTLGGHPETNVLGETYYSQAAIRYGDYIAKVCVAPSSPSLKALTGAKVDLHDKPNGLREAVVSHFAAQGGEWELRVQLCTDLEAMPVEDASVPWPEDRSPYVTVARIVADPQTAWSQARSVLVDDGMLFSPWHGVTAHQPLGNVMRARKQVYEMSKRFRAERNGVAVTEPDRDAVLP
jgi:hypothetical protein